MNLLSIMPFIGWWLALFLAWSLLIGPFVFAWNRVGGTTDLRHPVRLFGWFLLLGLGGLFLLQGSLVGPFVLLAPFWLGAVVHGMRPAVPNGWRGFCLVVLVLVVVVIPLSYVLRGSAPTAARHGVRPPLSTPTTPSTPPAPTTTPATPPSAASQP